MKNLRVGKVIRGSARFTSGLAVLGVVALAGVAGVTATWPQVSNTAAQTLVVPAPNSAEIVCQGPFTVLGRDSTAANLLSAVAQPELTWGASVPSPEIRQLVSAVPDASGATVIFAPLQGVAAPKVSGAESFTVSDEDVAGFAASACQEPLIETWLVGGESITGSYSVLSLANPGSVTAAVTVTVFGATVHSTEINVPPGQEVSTAFAALDVDRSGAVIRVRSQGAAVRAALQSSLIRTLEPGGIDVQSSSGMPQQELVIAGIAVTKLSQAQSSASVRILAVGQDTEIDYGIYDAQGKQVQRDSISLDADRAGSIALSDLDTGIYSVHLNATGPLVASAMQVTGTGPGSDFSWMNAAPALSSATLFSVPQGPTATLHLVNNSDLQATVTLRPRTGSAATTQAQEIAPGKSILVPVDAGKVYELDTSSPIHAAVTMWGTVNQRQALAGWPLWPTEESAQPVTVFP